MDIGAWLVKTYGQDLSRVTEIKGIPKNVTGAFLFFRIRSKEKRLSFFLFFTDDAIEVVLAETITNLNPPDTSADTSTVPTFRPAGTLDALANCTSLTNVDVSRTNLKGQSYARSASLFLTCTANC